MKIDLQLDADCAELSVTIHAREMNEEVRALLQKLSAQGPELLLGFRGGAATPLEPSEILRGYAASQKVFLVAKSGEFQSRLRLYELEERLSPFGFVRISNSEIVNLKEVRDFDMNLSGTIRVRLKDGSSTYVSRRYVARIKEILGT
ncbi:MAG: LytTR family transcriptional regulator [Christensenellaceae bacterium]|jgi:DNA-binding LytR/AlgR family response regulator|nr:LytTR family transcriptional regulator [Christensenellaceae bacterium]